MFIVYDENMNLKPFPSGVTPLDIFISSIRKKRETETVEGRHGYIDKGHTLETRNIELIFRLQAHNTQDYRLLRDEVFAYYSQGDFFYVSEEYQPGKRYKVIAVEPFVPERINRKVASVGIQLEMDDLPFAESIGTTQDIQRNGINTDSGLWGFGMGLQSVDDAMIYTHNAISGNTFRIFNAGNVSIHPFDQDLKITISNVVGSTELFQLVNLTNGSRARIDVPLKSTDKVIYDGPNVTRNSLAFLRDTRKNFIELSPGWNSFQIYNCNSATIAFDFPFYYQ
ncbi:hypothetical protein BLX87_23180 [Bacillus sp. VT-16-64]|nr:hypothetical protein BLX87_23180 [Bacillus sp. VT-16-64]